MSYAAHPKILEKMKIQNSRQRVNKKYKLKENEKRMT